jgi:hypothetical protein
VREYSLCPSAGSHFLSFCSFVGVSFCTHYRCDSIYCLTGFKEWICYQLKYVQQMNGNVKLVWNEICIAPVYVLSSFYVGRFCNITQYIDHLTNTFHPIYRSFYKCIVDKEFGVIRNIYVFSVFVHTKSQSKVLKPFRLPLTCYIVNCAKFTYINFEISLFPSRNNNFCIWHVEDAPVHVKISANDVIVSNLWFSGSGAFPGLIDISTSRPVKSLNNSW